MMDCINVHNHGFVEEDTLRIAAALRPCFDRAKAEPHLHAAMVLGDLNHVDAVAESSVTNRAMFERSSDSSAHWSELWLELLIDGIDIQFPAFTHYNVGTDKLNVLSRAVFSLAMDVHSGSFTSRCVYTHVVLCACCVGPCSFNAEPWGPATRFMR